MEKTKTDREGRKLHFYCAECQTIMSNENLKKKPEQVHWVQKLLMCKCNSKKKWYRMYV